MFESDDFDQVLSQFDFPGEESVKLDNIENLNTSQVSDKIQSSVVQQDSSDKTEVTTTPPVSITSALSDIVPSKLISKYPDKNVTCKQDKENDDQESHTQTLVVPNHNKRKIINSYFDHQSKRKFPGPAGLLTGILEEPKDDSICQIELLSQDVDFAQHNLRRDIFESPIWARLQSDMQTWGLVIDSIKTIKELALTGNLRRMKAQSVTAFVEAIDNSTIGISVILSDATGSIKCTLHQDAWASFSSYLVSEHCALILQKPTVLTTRGAFKKHYLNITLGNILAVYSSTVLNEDGNKALLDSYHVTVCNDEFSVIKTKKDPEHSGLCSEQSNGAEELIDSLDSFFCDDDIF